MESAAVIGARSGSERLMRNKGNPRAIRYIAALVAAALVFIVVGLLEGAFIGQMLDGIRKPNGIERFILYLGQFAVPAAAGIWAFVRTKRVLR